MENEELEVVQGEQEIQDKFLPVGTVVLLKGGKKELMIMSYCATLLISV